MKTFFVIYILSFVSIVAIYVHDHSTPRMADVFDPAEMARCLEALSEVPPTAPEDFITEVPAPSRPLADMPEVTGEEQRRMKPVEMPETAGDERDKEIVGVPEVMGDLEGAMAPMPRTFEGLDARIAALQKQAPAEPDLYVNIAECHKAKAEMYRAAAADLESREKSGGPVDAAELRLYRQKRVESLENALRALNKAPRNIYEHTDVRLMKAWVCLSLPDRAEEGKRCLEELAGDAKADARLREAAKRILDKLNAGK
jgi:hypothetical protein